jgi:hypothetical protein
MTTGWLIDRTAPEKGGEAPVASFALCLDCGADIEAWRERLLPVRGGTLAITERGELALHVEREGVCDGCGGGRAEIRVEGRDRRLLS